MTTTEERIAQLAQGFGQGIQNFQQGQDRQRQQSLQDEARRRQEALQAIEVAGAMGVRDGRVYNPAEIAPLIQSGDLSKFGELMQAAPISDKFKAEQARLGQEQQLKDLQTRKLQEDLRQTSLPFEQTREGKKLSFEQDIKRKQESDPKFRLSKMGAEAANKVGSIASGMQALSGVENAIGAGFKPQYVDANTPFIGGVISDTDLTTNQRILSEVVGRLQSGGAINKEEEKRFMAMGPRPGDSVADANKKIQQQKDFLANKLTAFGFKTEDLPVLGFKVDAPAVAPTGGFDLSTGQLMNTANASGDGGFKSIPTSDLEKRRAEILARSNNASN